MYNNKKSAYKNDIDLYELYNVLWYYKLLIILSIMMGIFYAGYFIINSKNIYTSTVVFKLAEDKSQNDTSSLIGGLVGISTGKRSSLPEDKVKGRIFIEELDEKLNFKSDPYYNSYNPNFKDPVWKSTLKKLIGWNKTQINQNEIIWQTIVLAYNNSVTLTETEAGAFKISVSHNDPNRSAYIANQITKKIIDDTEKERLIVLDEQLKYMYETVAVALDEVNSSQFNLKEFSIEYGALPIESFAAGSIQLDLFREQFAITKNLHNAVAELATLLKKNNLSQDDYISLQNKHPIINQVEFRRILGQSEIISTWNWPSENTVLNVLSTLSERLESLDLKIENSQKNAEISGDILDTYAKLKREATIAEASYSVLIERAKTQDVLAGYRSEKSEIFEYASPPNRASEPKRFLILALGAIIGLITGCVLALFLSLKKQVFYSKNKLFTTAQAKIVHRSKVFKALKKFEWDNKRKSLAQNQLLTLRNITQELYKSNSRYNIITSLDSRILASVVANAIAHFMMTRKSKIAIVDLSGHLIKSKSTTKANPKDHFLLSENKEFISIFVPNHAYESIDMFSHPNLLENLDLLTKAFDRTFICANNDDAISLSQIMEDETTFHVLISRRVHTKIKMLLNIKLYLPIQGLLHG